MTKCSGLTRHLKNINRKKPLRKNIKWFTNNLVKAFYNQTAIILISIGVIIYVAIASYIHHCYDKMNENSKSESDGEDSIELIKLLKKTDEVFIPALRSVNGFKNDEMISKFVLCVFIYSKISDTYFDELTTLILKDKKEAVKIKKYFKNVSVEFKKFLDLQDTKKIKTTFEEGENLKYILNDVILRFEGDGNYNKKLDVISDKILNFYNLNRKDLEIPLNENTYLNIVQAMIHNLNYQVNFLKHTGNY
ncbi:hypothetical protein NGRA_2848 [Nosema granulosis]|uniref:Uncharacterized protein n=1 Tax=Nosema granulosis TaxID=83296 RepID=A0A9P6KXR5_9MICR|nr:hypothetical protein NGRA_2848 [Nosema granulosis]